MVILSIEVLVPGNVVGKFLGDNNATNPKPEETTPQVNNNVNNAPRPMVTSAPPAPRPIARSNLNDSISNGITTSPIAALSPYQNRYVFFFYLYK